MTATPPLDMIENIGDLCRLSEGELQSLAAELRDATIGAVSKTGGHLGAGLGVVDLTVALHYVFQTPHDRLSWDVGLDADGIAAALRVMPGLDEADTSSSSQSKTSS